MNNTVTNEPLEFDTEEFKNLFDEVVRSREAQQKRNEMGLESFKHWLYDIIYELARGLGYVIGSFVDFNRKVYGSFKQGFWDGFNSAMDN